MNRDTIQRSWIRDALDRALAESYLYEKATAVREFIDNVMLNGNPDGPTPTQYQGLKNKKDAA